MKKLILTMSMSVLAFPAMAQNMEMGMEMKDGMMMDHGSMSAQINTHEAHEDGEQAIWLKPITAEYVCMVNDTRFDKVQIPTEVDGKTYYGCCSMCKAKLEKSSELREATDPVSGNIVDKATAVIGADTNNAVYYFENEENMKAFNDKQATHDSEAQDDDGHDAHH